MLGILNTPGILTRPVGSQTAIDAIVYAFSDLRVGPSFAFADLVVPDPDDWRYLKLQKSTTGLYVLAQNEPNLLGDLDNIFGVHVMANTKCPLGTAIVLDTNIPCQAWTRLGMEIMANQYRSGNAALIEGYMAADTHRRRNAREAPHQGRAAAAARAGRFRRRDLGAVRLPGG